MLRSQGCSGYKGVGFNSSLTSKPYQAKVSRGGKLVSLGYFATPEEAALSIAVYSLVRRAREEREPPSAAIFCCGVSPAGSVGSGSGSGSRTSSGIRNKGRWPPLTGLAFCGVVMLNCMTLRTSSDP